jgi:hypothetical protein
VTTLSTAEVAQQSPLLFIFDGVLILVAVWLTRRWTSRRIMMKMSGLIVLFSVPIWSALSGASWSAALLLRGGLVVLGVLFCAPFRLWAMELGQGHARATLTFVGYALGCQLFGAPTALVGMWLFHATGWAGAAGLYPALLALLVYASLYAEGRELRTAAEVAGLR